ncbi:hypothetical protein [uncultured Spirosoma sp.]|uniref:hypothetical protein n=1 Tax=uncultured Spirosoma sp. TaxID=278208 RepID=UPI00258F0AD8|nr:hypothetical protein [uncultured Spirosoma sp.]
MNTQLFSTTVITKLADKPVVRVRIHKDKYIRCNLIRCHFSNDSEDRWKMREYIYVEKDDVLLDAKPGLYVEPDGTVALRGQDSIHPDDWYQLRTHWETLVTGGHWRLLDQESTPVVQNPKLAVSINNLDLMQGITEKHVDPEEFLAGIFEQLASLRTEIIWLKTQVDDAKEKGYSYFDDEEEEDYDDY